MAPLIKSLPHKHKELNLGFQNPHKNWVVLVQITIAVTKYHDQCNLERKGFIWLILFQIAVPYWEKSGQELKQKRNLEAAADTEALGAGYCSLSCSLGLAYPAFL